MEPVLLKPLIFRGCSLHYEVFDIIPGFTELSEAFRKKSVDANGSGKGSVQSEKNGIDFK